MENLSNLVSFKSELARTLTVPNEVVATDGLSVFVRPVNDVVATGEVEMVARGLDGELQLAVRHGEEPDIGKQ